jgi:hypothetical protein
MLRSLAIALLAAGCIAEFEEPTACDSPAPLQGHFDPQAPGFFVSFRDDVIASDETARLERVHGFVAEQTWASPPGFFAELPDVTVQILRCEPSVGAIEHNSVTTPGAR